MRLSQLHLLRVGVPRHASIETLDAQTYGDGSRKHLTTSLEMSQAACALFLDLVKKLTNTQKSRGDDAADGVSPVKARLNTAEQMELLREEEPKSSAAPSKLRRLARR